jgi:hypothetical protein
MKTNKNLSGLTEIEKLRLRINKLENQNYVHVVLHERGGLALFSDERKAKQWAKLRHGTYYGYTCVDAFKKVYD